MGRKLYVECPRGMSCRMLLGALAGLGADMQKVESVITELFQNKVQIQRRYRQISWGKAVECWIDEEENRTEAEKKKAVLESELSQKLKEDFFWIAEHTAPSWEERESLTELLAVLLAVEQLGFTEFLFSQVGEGMGMEEGKLIPAPLLLEMAQEYQIPLSLLPGEEELLTPLAMGLLIRLGTTRALPFRVFAEASSIGCGEAENAVRAVLWNTERAEEKHRQSGMEKRDVVMVLETNVDDCSGEQLGYAIERLMKAGALDASCFPLYMKKHRPAYMLQVICKKETQKHLETIIFRETTSIGLRRYEEERRILPRCFQEFTLKDGNMVRIKICEHHGEKFYYPEYDTIKAVCKKTGRAFWEIYEEAASLAHHTL